MIIWRLYSLVAVSFAIFNFHHVEGSDYARLWKTEEKFILGCITNRIVRIKEKLKCQEFRSTLDDAKHFMVNNTHTKPLTPSSYLLDLVNWRNGEYHNNEMLEKVSSCSKHFKTISKLWEKRLNARRHLQTAVPLNFTTEWNDDRGYITFHNIGSSFSGNSLIAAELILNRFPSNDIGESYGRYVTKAYIIDDQEHRHLVHSDVQLSCPSDSGNYMMLNFDNLNLLKLIYNDKSSQLKMQVIVRPIRQYFEAQYSEDVEHVVRNIVGIAMHFDPQWPNSSDDRIFRNELFKELNTDAPPPVHNDDNRRLVRQVRSSSEIFDQEESAGCKLVDFQFPRSLYKKLKISSPEYQSMNIFECSGSCDMRNSNLNITTHGKIIAREMQNNSPNEQLSICCVPITYKTINVISIVDSPAGYMSSTAFPMHNVAATSCGCR